MDIPKSIPVYLNYYIVEGIVNISLWGEGSGRITMTSSIIKEPTREEALRKVNDGGYGCENINSAEVLVYAVYTSDIDQSKGNVSVLVADFVFSDRELVNAKRGL